MITDCLGLRFWDMSDVEPVFLENTALVLKVAIPAAFCLAQWKLAAAKRRLNQRTPSILGLDVVGEPAYDRNNWVDEQMQR
jgi:hypothetical protein